MPEKDEEKEESQGPALALEQELLEEKKTSSYLRKLQMDKKRIGELVEEVDRLKAKSGEAETTKGPLRPQNVDRLPPGSVNTSLNNRANNNTSAAAKSPKTPARGKAEKSFMDNTEQTRLDPNNTCRAQ